MNLVEVPKPKLYVDIVKAYDRATGDEVEDVLMDDPVVTMDSEDHTMDQGAPDTIYEVDILVRTSPSTSIDKPKILSIT